MEWYRVKKAPLVLGHEIAGTVEAVGEGVVKFSVCETLRTTTFYPGGFAEFVRVPAINVDRGVFRLPDSMSFEEGSFSEPLGCVVRALAAAGMETGKSMLVIGSGMSGLLHIRLARALGAGFIAATDINPFRLKA